MAASNQALVVGVSAYPPVIGPLPGVVNDVREVGRLLQNPGGGFPAGVRVLTDADATRAAVLSALGDVFAADAGAIVFAYLAGHGAAAGDDFYFVPIDADPADLEGTCVPLAEVRQLFQECPSERVLLFLDCCHSGGIIPRRTSAQAATPEQTREAMRRTLSVVHGKGKLIFAACTPKQFAYESQAVQHGFFTHALVRGLRGAAAGHDHKITANSLFDFIAAEVEVQAGSIQQPMQFGHATGRIILMHDVGGGHSDELGPGPAAAPKAAGGGGSIIVSDTGSLIMLGDSFFEECRVRRQGDEITVQVPSFGAGTDAAVEALRPPRFGGAPTLPYAHLNDGDHVRVENVGAEFTGERQVWTVKLRRLGETAGTSGFDVAAYSSGGRHYSPLEIVRMRAGRILLNDPPVPAATSRGAFGDGFLEAFIAGGDGGRGLSANRCPIRDLYPQNRGDPAGHLRRARLASVFLLRATKVAEQVLDLALGPISEDGVAVRFTGRRAKVYDNVEPELIQVEGTCPLP